jgi:branched-chain amino acid transport system ATP-binding protein
MSTELLIIEQLEVSYGSAQALFGVSLSVHEGQFVTLLGRNGMGKSTTVKALMGLVRANAGTVRFAGHNVLGKPAYAVGQLGIGLVPEGRQIFPTLTVEENLIATAHNKQGHTSPWTLARVYTFFPRLKERAKNLGSQLSGGEQQMLAIGRALMTNPRLLVLDEATEGLAPIIRAEIWACLAQLKVQGMAILCIDKNLKALLPLADEHFILEKGCVVWQGNSSALTEQSANLHRYLGV